MKKLIETMLAFNKRCGLCDVCKDYNYIVGSITLFDEALDKELQFNVCKSCAYDNKTLKLKKRVVTMVSASSMLGGNYLNATQVKDLKLKNQKCKIKEVKVEKMPQDSREKLVLYFDKSDKGLVLNTTNAKVLIEAYGDDTDKWKDKTFTIRIAKVNFNGELKDGIQLDTEVS